MSTYLHEMLGLLRRAVFGALSQDEKSKYDQHQVHHTEITFPILKQTND